MSNRRNKNHRLFSGWRNADFADFSASPVRIVRATNPKRRMLRWQSKNTRSFRSPAMATGCRRQRKEVRMAAMFYDQDVTDMSIRQINALFRAHDESHLWPVCGRFNVTERAIRRLRKVMQCNGSTGGFEYALMLDGEIGRIVNEEN